MLSETKEQSTPTFDLEHPERISYEGVNGVSLLKEIMRVLSPMHLDAVQWLESGGTSRNVAKDIVSNAVRFAPQHDNAWTLYRLEFLQRVIRIGVSEGRGLQKAIDAVTKAVQPGSSDGIPEVKQSGGSPTHEVDEPVKKSTTEVDESADANESGSDGMGEANGSCTGTVRDANQTGHSRIPNANGLDGHCRPVVNAPIAPAWPDARSFTYEPGDIQKLLSEIRSLPRILLGIATDLLLTGEYSEAVTHCLLRQPERGGLQEMDSCALLYRIQLLRRFVQWLKKGWKKDHPDSADDDEQMLEYIRQRVRGVADARTDTEQAIAAVTEVAPSEIFDYEPGDCKWLMAPLEHLRGPISSEFLSRLRAGECSEKVTDWLAEQPLPDRLQELEPRELLYRVECKRRHLFYDRDPGPVVRPTSERMKTSGEHSGGSEKDRKPIRESKERVLLLWGISQLPDLMFAQFTHLLMEGGTVTGRVLRISGQLCNRNERRKGTGNISHQTSTMATFRDQDGQTEKSSFRAAKGESMLRTIGKLPPHVLHEAIRLLEYGAKATVVARFLRSHDDLGRCRRLSASAMRQYTQHLRRLVLAGAKPDRARKQFLHQVAKHIRQQQFSSLNRMLEVKLIGAKGSEGKRIASVPEPQSLASLKNQLEELFRSDPLEVVQDLLGLRREPEPNAVCDPGRTLVPKTTKQETEDLAARGI